MRKWEVVDVLRHYRHDWLNKLQLIKGNLDIGRIEKVEGLIQEVIQQSKNESDLSNLNSQKLAERLLTFNWEEHPYVLFYEILTEDKNWGPIESRVMGILNHIFLLFDSHAKYGYDNQLIVILKDVDGAELELDYHGQLLLNDNWHSDLENFQKQYANVIRKIEWDENGLFLNIHF
ncbi:stage 0 sporulation protein B (sporulation initiation phosphotransferase) [Evansella vedderi]|uniref:Stage 0 sporulation protein B (Sporulation initiation phosphotransferase) n=1 Tax=Evansella vedderi TaxID=38282 RepID=A0ABT9ZSM7_9BACI|nr:Spo0B C-terminal domain-containing protein [Evansella vedderi]MDQ0254235.1 stage 0 sporulation protein B (sporulation initiation phosphotransferase) [Evansella vedderi]